MEGHAQFAMCQVVHIDEELAIENGSHFATCPGFIDIEPYRLIKTKHLAKDFLRFITHTGVNNHLKWIPREDAKECKIKDDNSKKSKNTESELLNNEI